MLLTDPLLRSFLRGVPSFHFWWGGSSQVSTTSSPYLGKHITGLGEWHHHFIPEEGKGAIGVPRWEITGVGSSLVMDIWGEMVQRVGKDMFPISSWRGYISTPWAPGGRSVGPPHRWLGKIGSLTSPPQWPPFPNPPYCPCELAAKHVCSILVVSVSLMVLTHVASAC